MKLNKAVKVLKQKKLPPEELVFSAYGYPPILYWSDKNNHVVLDIYGQIMNFGMSLARFLKDDLQNGDWHEGIMTGDPEVTSTLSKEEKEELLNSSFKDPFKGEI